MSSIAPTESSATRCVAWRCAAFVASAIAWFALALICAWLIGRVLTDRTWWSQWLWWIPTPITLIAACLGTLSTLTFRRKAQARGARIAWSFMLIGLAVYFAAFEHRLLHSASAIPNSGGVLKLMHWNAEPTVWAEVEPTLHEVIDVDADMTVLSNPGGTFQHELAQRWIADGHEVVYASIFAIATRVPIVNVRPLIAVDEMYLVAIEFGASAKLNRPFTMYLLDLPSDPRIGRMAMARRIRKMLNDLHAPPPDIVVGDFNIPRGSASIDVMFPNMTEAYNEAGHGIGATFHRAFPLYHIDHVLLGANLRALRYDIIDPKLSRHRAQVAWIAANSTETK